MVRVKGRRAMKEGRWVDREVRRARPTTGRRGHSGDAEGQGRGEMGGVRGGGGVEEEGEGGGGEDGEEEEQREDERGKGGESSRQLQSEGGVEGRVEGERPQGGDEEEQRSADQPEDALPVRVLLLLVVPEVLR